jgi:hypothetical protein
MEAFNHSSEPPSAGDRDEALTRFLIEALPAAAFLIDPDGRIAALNLKAETLQVGMAPRLVEGRLTRFSMAVLRVARLPPSMG